MKAFLNTLSYSYALSPGVRYRDVGGFELLLEFLGQLGIEHHS